MKTYILLTGYARSGKDTVAKMLRQLLLEDGIKANITPLSAPIKTISAYVTDNESEVDSTEDRNKLMSNGYTPRKFWQIIGTEMFQDVLIKHSKEFRKRVGRTIWCKYLHSGAKSTDVTIVPDVRFPHEVKFFDDLSEKDYCTIVINVARFKVPWYRRMFLHRSERYIHKLPYNGKVHNNGEDFERLMFMVRCCYTNVVKPDMQFAVKYAEYLPETKAEFTSSMDKPRPYTGGVE